MYNKSEYYIGNSDEGADKVKINTDLLLPTSPYATSFGILNTIDNPLFKGLEKLNGRFYKSNPTEYHSDLIEDVLKDIQLNKSGIIRFENSSGNHREYDSSSKNFDYKKITTIMPFYYHRTKMFSPCGRAWINFNNIDNGPFYIFSFWNELMDGYNTSWETYSKLIKEYEIPRADYDLLKFKFIDYTDYLSLEELKKELNVSVHREKTKEERLRYADLQSKRHIIGGLAYRRSRIKSFGYQSQSE